MEESHKEEVSSNEPPISIWAKAIAVLLGAGGALLAAYFGLWVFNKIKSYAHKSLNNGLPPPSELPTALRDISPVVWNEAKRLTKSIPK